MKVLIYCKMAAAHCKDCKELQFPLDERAQREYIIYVG